MRYLYLHGFASGPDSTKGTRLAAHFGAAPTPRVLRRLDLRRPSMEHLRVSAMIEHVRGEIGDGPAVVLGSSLGGLTAARVAEQDDRVVGVVLLAPAFQLARRWRAAQPDVVARWQERGYTEVDDHARGGTARVDYGFLEDAEAVDQVGDGWPDVRVPTLLIHGTADEVVTIGRSREWAAARPHVRMVEVADGHELSASLDRIIVEVERFFGEHRL